MIFDKPIVYKLDDDGMWWSEVCDIMSGQWYSMCHTTHGDAMHWANAVAGVPTK